ncbi:MAG: Isopentenyl-diphosphate Delta-isomerase, partial [uncultured Corynebacteriales bacterium]
VAGRGAAADRHRPQGRGAHGEHAAAPGLLVVRVRPERHEVAGHPAGPGEEDLARGVDEHLLRAPGAGRGPDRGDGAPAVPGAGRRAAGRGAGAAGLRVHRDDARRDDGERVLPGLPGGRRRRPRPGPGRGGRLEVGGLELLPGRRRARALADLPLVRAAGRSAGAL